MMEMELGEAKGRSEGRGEKEGGIEKERERASLY